jgi:hypothetical protein
MIENFNNFFNEDFFESLPQKPSLAGLRICLKFLEFNNVFTEPKIKKEHYEQYVQALGVLKAFSEANDFVFTYPEISGDPEDINIIVKFFQTVRRHFQKGIANLELEESVDKFSKHFGNFCYVLSQGDVERIQSLISQLRETISNSGEFPEEYKKRLIKRLERLQSEVHKRMSNYDRFWGLMGDLGIARNKPGKDAKTVTEYMEGILTIVFRSQAIAEQLPSDSRLPIPEKPDSDQETGGQ